MQTPLQELVEQIEAGSLQVSVAKTFALDEIADAHRTMEEGEQSGREAGRAAVIMQSSFTVCGLVSSISKFVFVCVGQLGLVVLSSFKPNSLTIKRDKPLSCAFDTGT